MGLAGAGYGAAKGLEEVLAQQMQQALLAQRQQEAESRAAIDRERLAESARQADVDSGQRQQTIDLQGEDRRARTNTQGVRRMLGEAITQGQGPMQSADRRGLAALQAEAGDDPTLLNEPKPERDPIADHAAKAQIDAKYRTPQRPERDPIADHEAKLKLDAKYKQQGGNSDPAAEARETASEAKRIATDLMNHKGLDGAFGVINSRLPTFRQDTADAEVLRDALTSLLTLENMGKMKGVLSDSDMKVLRQASTTIAGPMSPQSARAELKRVSEVMGRAAGESPMPKMDMATSRGTAPAPSSRVDDLIKKYGGKP